MLIVDDNTSSSLSQEDICSDMKSWGKLFIEYKSMRGVSVRTIKSYRESLESFFKFVEIHKDGNKMENVGAKFINRFLIQYQSSLAKLKLSKNNVPFHEVEKYNKIILQEEQLLLGRNDMDFEVLSDFENTLLHRASVVKMFLKYISINNEEGHDYQSCFSDIKTLSLKEKDTDCVTVDEMDEVIDLMSNWICVYKSYKQKGKLASAYRDSLMILIYALTGARSEEVVKIKLKDVTPLVYYKKNYYKIFIREGKGGKQREIAIHEDYIKKHIEYLREYLPNGECYLSATFRNGVYTDKSMSPNNIRTFGNYVLQVLGINKSGLHSFRRGYATIRVVNNGIPIAVVAKEIGNSTSVMERFYFKHNATHGLDDGR